MMVRPSFLLVLLPFVLVRCAFAGPVDAQRVLTDLGAAAQRAAAPLGGRGLGTPSWTRVDTTAVNGKSVPLVKAKLALPLEAASGIVRWMATDPRVSLANSTIGANAGETAVPYKGRTLVAANLSIEVAVAPKNAAGDKQQALAFGLVRHAMTSEVARFKDGSALLFKQLVIGPADTVHVEASAASPDALVNGLKHLSGEVAAGAAAAAPPVVLSDFKLTKLVRESAGGVDGVAVALDARPAPRPAGKHAEGFELLGTYLKFQDKLPAMHADLRTGGANASRQGNVEIFDFKSGFVKVSLVSTFARLPAMVKLLEDDPAVDAGDMLVALAQETTMFHVVDAKGVEISYPNCRVMVAFGNHPAPHAFKRGDLTRAFETLGRVFTGGGNEFYVVQLVPPVAGASPPPPPPPVAKRPVLRDIRVTNGAFEMNFLFHDAAELTAATAALTKGGLNHFTIVKQSKEPYRDISVIAVQAKADLVP